MKQSAGILLYRFNQKELQVLLAHPGGPFWAKKDLGSWTIPKGELEEAEDPLTTAKREFEEETGQIVDIGTAIALTPIKQKNAKLVHAWVVEGDMDVLTLKSNTFELAWPPKSGKMAVFPEINKVQWFPIHEALLKILPGQQGFINELQHIIREKIT